MSYTEILGSTNDAVGFSHTTWIGILSKVLAIIFNIVCTILTLIKNAKDHLKYESDPFVSAQSGDEELNAKVDYGSFRDALIAYSVFFAFNIIYKAFVICIQAPLILNREKTVPWLWVPMVFVLEMPLLVSGTCMMKARGIIDWNDQFWDLVLHILFVLQIPLFVLNDIWNLEERNCGMFCVGLCCSLLVFVPSCMLYAPVSIAMVGVKYFQEITMKDFGNIKVTEDTKNVLLILATFGNIGQYMWSFIATAFVIAICSSISKKQDEKQETLLLKPI